MSQTVTSERSFRAALSELAGAQKTSQGAPAYSRFINRPLGRRFAAAAYVVGLTPNQVTVISALFTYSAIAVIATVSPAWWVSLAVLAGLVVGYGLDAADGQLARLLGGGSPTGEWLDHTVDALKISVLHLSVAVHWYRFDDTDPRWLLVPLGFQAVATTHFFSMLLMDQIRRAHRGGTSARMAGDGSSSVWYSLAVAPTDYGVLCLVFGLMFVDDLFRVLYLMFFLANFGFLALALPKWYREVGRLGTADGR